MKKTVICNIPMMKNVDKCIYSSEDSALKSANKAVLYPINAFLANSLTENDEVKDLLLIKRTGAYQENTASFIEELSQINKGIGAKIEHELIETDFVEEKRVHEQLMGRIVEEIDNNSHIIADITYGPKDLPIVLFAALNFVERFLDCEIENIIYGQAKFEDGKPVDTKLCDMTSLYYLNSVTNTMNCDDYDKARKMLRTLLSM